MYNRFAAARRRYLRTHMDGIYTGMLLTGTLEPHHEEIDESAQGMFDRHSGLSYTANLRQGVAVEYVSCEPTESARELFEEDCEPVEEEQ